MTNASTEIRLHMTPPSNIAKTIEYQALLALFANARYQEACNAAEAIVKRAPESGLAWKILGTAKLLLGQDSVDSLTQARLLLPDDGVVCANLGKALLIGGQFRGAADACRAAIAIDSRILEAFCNLAIALRELGDVDGALLTYRHAVLAHPKSSMALTGLGTILLHSGEYREAEACFRLALEATPGYPEAILGMGFVKLVHGEYEDGWNCYESRWEVESWPVKLKTSVPRWDDRLPLHGKTILLVGEQGFGDSIQFARYIPVLAKMGAKVSVVVRDELKAVFGSLFGVEKVLGFRDEIPHFEYHCPLMSLPFACKATVREIPFSAGYVKSEEARSRSWEGVVGARPGMRVGVVWSGNPQFQNDANRSISLSQFSPIFHAVGCQFYSLQKVVDERAKEVMGEIEKVTDLSPMLSDFGETAAAISNLDLVITVDSAVAHLAGSMGKAVWVLLPFVPDWRWMLRREDSPWYDSVRLFRQTVKGDWPEVISRVQEALTQAAEKYLANDIVRN